MDKITHEVRLANWKQIILQCSSRPEGQTVKQWLTENGLKEKSYYYWQRKIRKEAFNGCLPSSLPVPSAQNNITFAELPIQNEPANVISEMSFQPDIVMKTGTLTIGISNTVSESLLSRILEATRHAG